MSKPIALFHGDAVSEIPASLYIPPTAMQVCLDFFEGPLDLLLFLVRKHRLNILDVPMTILVRQYLSYVEEILEKDLGLASDYLAMSAWLIEIKTKMMLPVPFVEEEEEGDPRADLIQRLLEYDRLRQAAVQLAALPRRDRDFCSPFIAVELPTPDLKPMLYGDQLVSALMDVQRRQKEKTPYMILPEQISIRRIMTELLKQLAQCSTVSFYTLTTPQQGGATFIALLQLSFENLIDLQQENTQDELMVTLL